MSLTASVESLLATLREYEGACPCRTDELADGDGVKPCYGTCQCCVYVRHTEWDLSPHPACINAIHSIRRRVLEELKAMMETTYRHWEDRAALAAIERELSK